MQLVQRPWVESQYHNKPTNQPSHRAQNNNKNNPLRQCTHAFILTFTFQNFSNPPCRLGFQLRSLTLCIHLPHKWCLYLSSLYQKGGIKLWSAVSWVTLWLPPIASHHPQNLHLLLLFTFVILPFLPSLAEPASLICPSSLCFSPFSVIVSWHLGLMDHSVQEPNLWKNVPGDRTEKEKRERRKCCLSSRLNCKSGFTVRKKLKYIYWS